MMCVFFSAFLGTLGCFGLMFYISPLYAAVTLGLWNCFNIWFAHDVELLYLQIICQTLQTISEAIFLLIAIAS